MPCAPILEGPLLFLPPFEIHGLCVLLFSMFGLEMLCHFGRFYLSASVGVRRPGFGLKSLGHKGGRFNQPGVGLWSECYSLRFHFFLFVLSALWWPVVLYIQHLPLNLFLTHSEARLYHREIQLCFDLGLADTLAVKENKQEGLVVDRNLILING